MPDPRSLVHPPERQRTFTLADSFDATSKRVPVDLSAPLPLGHHQAIKRGLELRAKGTEWTWPVISEVMAEYHGIRRSARWWQRELRAAGAESRQRNPHTPNARQAA